MFYQLTVVLLEWWRWDLKKRMSAKFASLISICAIRLENAFENITWMHPSHYIYVQNPVKNRTLESTWVIFLNAALHVEQYDGLPICFWLGTNETDWVRLLSVSFVFSQKWIGNSSWCSACRAACKFHTPYVNGVINRRRTMKNICLCMHNHSPWQIYMYTYTHTATHTCKYLRLQLKKKNISRIANIDRFTFSLFVKTIMSILSECVYTKEQTYAQKNRDSGDCKKSS